MCSARRRFFLCCVQELACFYTEYSAPCKMTVISNDPIHGMLCICVWTYVPNTRRMSYMMPLHCPLSTVQIVPIMSYTIYCMSSVAPVYCLQQVLRMCHIIRICHVSCIIFEKICTGVLLKHIIDSVIDIYMLSWSSSTSTSTTPLYLTWLYVVCMHTITTTMS